MLLINDVRRQNHSVSGEIEEAIARVLARGWYILGPEVQAFEKEFASYCGVAECVGTGNGTDALELALRAAGVRPGDRVGTVANAGMYSTTAILRAGATPVFVDVDPSTMLMSAGALGSAANLRFAIITHLYGRMADMPALLRTGVPLIEDCAQAHGARLSGKTAGSWGIAGCFSFYPTKNLGALGDGGAVITQDPAMGGRLRSLRQYGWSDKYISSLEGGRNSRLDELQAAILRVKLRHLDGWNQRRRSIAARYDEAFGVARMAGPEYVAHLYVIRARERERLRMHLAGRGIATDIHYPVPDHLQPSIRVKAELPASERLCQEVLTLPLFPEMTGTEVDAVIAAVHEALDETRASGGESLYT